MSQRAMPAAAFDRWVIRSAMSGTPPRAYPLHLQVLQPVKMNWNKRDAVAATREDAPMLAVLAGAV
jgi:hypothetical protein